MGSGAPEGRFTVQVPAKALSNLALSETQLLFVVTPSELPPGDSRPTRVTVMDLSTRQVTEVATTQWPQGQVEGPLIAGSWAFWLDEARLPSTDWMYLPWRIHAHDLDSGATQALAESPTETAIPAMTAGSGRLAWAQGGPPGDTKGIDVHMFSPSTGAKHTLATGLKQVLDGTAGPDGFYYTVSDPGGQTLKPWRIAWSGGAPEAVEVPGQVRRLRMNDDGLASWEDSVSGPASRLGIGHLSAGSAPPAFMSMVNASNAAPGKDMVAFYDGDSHVRAVRVEPDGTLSAAIQVSQDDEELHVPCRIAAHGSTVAYCVEPATPGDPIIVVVTTLPDAQQ